ncbi:MAG TPA: DAK2 domain-containing protein [Micromonosporaceae bacterium]|nr:DAK2 domain-containing protein [Micromonosporaceae bacterium]
MLESLDGDAVRRWCAVGLAGLRRHQYEIDELNVYPVPDGDTGTNLVLTFAAAHDHLTSQPPTNIGATMAGFARGALLGARGNSGVIMSQLLAGFAGACDVAAVTGRGFADGLCAGADAAYQAVATPVEGTILSVARAAALAATAADSDDLAAVVVAAAGGAAEALAKTPDQLAELARAGVVDAGGRGLLVVLDALVEVVTGRVVVRPAAVGPNTRVGVRPVARETGSLDYAYEVQYLLDAHADAVETLKVDLSELGDSLVIVGTGPHRDDSADVTPPTWNIHVHVNDIGAALEAGLAAGRPHRISVTAFADQIAADAARSVAPPMPMNPFEPSAIVADEVVESDEPLRATVVVATGRGLAALFEAEGAAVVRGPSPSTAEILRAIRGTDAQHVVVLPDAAATQGAASAAAREARNDGIQVSVVPTRSPVQALAALAIRDRGRRFEDDVIAMAEAAGACRYAEVTYASREAITVAGRCQAGDVLAIVEGEVNLIAQDLGQACRELLDRLLAAGGELVTLMTGAQAPEDLATMLTAHLARNWPFVEAHVYQGGQPHHPLLVGIE